MQNEPDFITLAAQVKEHEQKFSIRLSRLEAAAHKRQMVLNTLKTACRTGFYTPEEAVYHALRLSGPLTRLELLHVTDDADDLIIYGKFGHPFEKVEVERKGPGNRGPAKIVKDEAWRLISD